jgi:hypothetical protein
MTIASIEKLELPFRFRRQHKLINKITFRPCRKFHNLINTIHSLRTPILLLQLICFAWILLF